MKKHTLVLDALHGLLYLGLSVALGVAFSSLPQEHYFRVIVVAICSLLIGASLARMHRRVRESEYK